MDTKDEALSGMLVKQNGIHPRNGGHACYTGVATLGPMLSPKSVEALLCLLLRYCALNINLTQAD